MMDEKREYALFKVGYSTDIDKRMYSYTTASPEMRCIDRVETYAKTHTELDKQIKTELRQRGFLRTASAIDGKLTEWFRVPYDSDFYQELTTKGLRTFKACDKRKTYGELTQSK